MCRIPVAYYNNTFSVVCEKVVKVGDLVYHITGSFGNLCYAMSSSDYERQESFTPETRISVAEFERGCRSADGSKLTLDNGNGLIYDINKLHQKPLEDGKTLR